MYRKCTEEIVRERTRKGKRMKFWIGRMTNNEKDDVGTGGYSGSGSAHWSVGLKKGWIFERTSRCKGWSARARLSVDVACVLRKTEWEEERKDERAWEGSKGWRSEKKRKKRAEKEREREREIKKRKRIHACARSAFSARVHLSYETSLELVSHKFPRKLVSEIRHFSHPRWLPLPPLLPLLLLFSSLYVPCTSRLL